MRLAKPILLVTTPLGVVGGLREAYKLAGGLVYLMAAMVAVMLVAVAWIVITIRRERAAETTGRQNQL
ncbi:MAG: hypothetical protein ABI567_03550 [Gammaproteobacteria bacterium]